MKITITPTEINTYLARYMGWKERKMTFDGKKLICFQVPNVFGEDNGWTEFTADCLDFHRDWNWFQEAFQKARKDYNNEINLFLVKDSWLMYYFELNDCHQACEILIEFLKENEK